MGEIKSTLELVMEKTKHLTLTRGEREAQQRGETAKRVRGLVQRFQDGRLNQTQFAQQVDELGKAGGPDVKGLLIQELLGGFELDGKNESRMVLLREICGVDVTAVDSVCRRYHETIRSTSRERMQLLNQQLARERGISGSAVIPNFETDEEWLAEVVGIRKRFGELLDREKASLRC